MSRKAFDIAATIDEQSLKALNARLRKLEKQDAQAAIKKGFRQWTRTARKIVRALAPAKSNKREGGHIASSITTRIKGYQRGQIQWAAVGVKEQRGSRDTPHWYLPWVEDGHAIRRRRRGPQVGYVVGRKFMKRAAQQLSPMLVPMVEKALNEVLDG